MLISHTEEKLDVPARFFGHQVDSLNRTKICLLAILPALAFITIFPSFRGMIYEGGPGITFFTFLVALMTLVTGMFVYLVEDNKATKKFIHNVNKSYSEWYLTTLIPFLSQRYQLEFNIPTEENYQKNLFASRGALAKTAQGKIIRVKVGGLEPYVDSLFTDKDHNWLKVRALSIKATLNGQVWLDKVAETNTLT